MKNRNEKVKIVLASNNTKKIRELQEILAPNLVVIAASEFDIVSPPETGTTFIENAIINMAKSKYIFISYGSVNANSCINTRYW